MQPEKDNGERARGAERRRGVRPREIEPYEEPPYGEESALMAAPIRWLWRASKTREAGPINRCPPQGRTSFSTSYGC
jgi:hypothetical protein